MGQNIVIIPTYNEKENIENIIRKVYSLAVNFDILIVDDGSPDGTSTIVKELQKEYPDRLMIIEREGKLGLGSAYIAGFRYCIEKGYSYVFEMDAGLFDNLPFSLGRRVFPRGVLLALLCI